MRYFTYKPSVVEKVPLQTKEGEKLVDFKVDYKDMLLEVIKVDHPLPFEPTMRLHSLFKRVETLNVNDSLAIEDQDFEILQQKLDAYVKTRVGWLVSVTAFIEFLQYLKDLPKEVKVAANS